MKKFCITFLLSGIIILTAAIFGGTGGFSNGAFGAGGVEYLRVHIRADSNAVEAQQVKYQVRDEVVEFLTPTAAICASFDEAAAHIQSRLEDIEAIASEVLQKQGFGYGARASLRRESFPTRVYGEYTLGAGEYLSLIIELGSGKGDNWWCVIYPPLCFAAIGGENVVYKSLILEKIEAWKARRGGV